MKHGNISNFSAPILAFNADNLIFKREKKKEGIAEKAIGFLTKLFINEPPEVDLRFAKLLNDLWHSHTTYSIYLLTRKSGNEKAEFENFLYENSTLLFTRLTTVPDLEVMRYTVANRYAYYFDSDKEYLVSLGTNNARHISEIGRCIGLGYSFPSEGE